MARPVEQMTQIHVRAGAQVECVQHPECLHLRFGSNGTDVTVFLWDDESREALIAALRQPIDADRNPWKMVRTRIQEPQ